MSEELTYRKCNQCEVEKELLEFFPRCLSRNKKHYTYEYKCKRCKQINQNVNREKLCRKGESKAVHLKAKYGITVQEYNDQLAFQKNKCAICEEALVDSFHTVVDHNHDTGEVRGILCRKCNTGIGMLKDSKEVLSKAIKYLESNVWQRLT